MSQNRLFFAIWPDTGIREKLGSVIKQVPAKAGRMIDQEKLHITLLYLGSVASELTESLSEAAGQVTVKPFSLVIDRTGWWRQPKVLWLGSSVVPEGMLELVNAINRIAAEFDLPTDARPYQPHVTFARKARRPLRELDFVPIDWEVREFCLVQSVTHPNGAEYKILERWELSD